MNTDTGKIEYLPPHTAAPPNYIRLGNLPLDDCWKCKGTGIKRINAKGRREPCPCTNPQGRVVCPSVSRL